MAEQVAQRDVSLQGFGVVNGLGTRAQHAQAAKFRNPLLDGRIQPEVALFDELHRQGRGDEFGIGKSALNMVGAQRFAGFQVGLPGAKRIDHLAMLQHDGTGTGQQAVVNTSLQNRMRNREIGGGGYRR